MLFFLCLVNFKELIPPNDFSHYCLAFRASLRLTNIRTGKTRLGLSDAGEAGSVNGALQSVFFSLCPNKRD